MLSVIYVLVTLGQVHANVAFSEEFLNRSACESTKVALEQKFKKDNEFLFATCVERPTHKS